MNATGIEHTMTESQNSVRAELEVLLQLAEIDAASRTLDIELKEIPERIQAMQADVQKLEMLLERERMQLKEAETLKRQQEDEVGLRNEALSKAKAKASKVKNSKEAEASEREVDFARKTIRDREDEVLELEEALQKVRASLTQHEQELEGVRAEVVKEEEHARVRLEQLRTERGAATEGRDRLIAKLSRSTFQAYERVRGKRGSAVATVLDGTCSGCRMSLRPQQVIEIQRAERISNCANCLRILVA